MKDVFIKVLLTFALVIGTHFFLFLIFWSLTILDEILATRFVNTKIVGYMFPILPWLLIFLGIYRIWKRKKHK